MECIKDLIEEETQTPESQSKGKRKQYLEQDENVEHLNMDLYCNSTSSTSSNVQHTKNTLLTGKITDAIIDKQKLIQAPFQEGNVIFNDSDPEISDENSNGNETRDSDTESIQQERNDNENNTSIYDFKQGYVHILFNILDSDIFDDIGDNVFEQEPTE